MSNNIRRIIRRRNGHHTIQTVQLRLFTAEGNHLRLTILHVHHHDALIASPTGITRSHRRTQTHHLRQTQRLAGIITHNAGNNHSRRTLSRRHNRHAGTIVRNVHARKAQITLPGQTNIHAALTLGCILRIRLKSTHNALTISSPHPAVRIKTRGSQRGTLPHAAGSALIHRVQARGIVRQAGVNIRRIAHRRGTQLGHATQKQLLTRIAHIVIARHHLAVRINSNRAGRNTRVQLHRRKAARRVLRNQSAVIENLSLAQTREVLQAVHNLLTHTRQTIIVQVLTGEANQHILVIAHARGFKVHRLVQRRERNILQVGRRASHQRTHQQLKVTVRMREPADIRHSITERTIIEIQAAWAKHTLKLSAVQPQTIRAGANAPLVIFHDHRKILSLSLSLRECARNTLTIHSRRLLETHMIRTLGSSTIVTARLHRITVHASRTHRIPTARKRRAQILARHSIILNAVHTSTHEALNNRLGGSTRQRSRRTRRRSVNALHVQTAAVLSHSIVRGKTRARAHERRQRHRTPRQRGASRNNSPMSHGGLNLPLRTKTNNHQLPLQATATR